MKTFIFLVLIGLYGGNSFANTQCNLMVKENLDVAVMNSSMSLESKYEAKAQAENAIEKSLHNNFSCCTTNNKPSLIVLMQDQNSNKEIQSFLEGVQPKIINDIEKMRPGLCTE